MEFIMRRTFFLILLTGLLVFGIVGCSDDNSTSPAEDYQNLDIPDDFNWTNLDYIKLNITIDGPNITGKNLVIVRHNRDVLARKFVIDGNLEMNINSVIGFDNLIIELPAFNFSQEISTSTKEHNILVPTSDKQRFAYQANQDPYFAGEIDDDNSDFLTINDISPWMIQSFIDNNNIHIPTQVPPANTGWHKTKFNPNGSGSIQKESDGLTDYLILGTDWVIMQTIDVEGYDYFNENLEGAKRPDTADLNDCPYGSYITNTYIFLDENMNYLSFFPWSPWTYTNTDRFFSDRTNNNLNNAKYLVIIGQYNGLQGNVRLDNWLVTLYDTEVSAIDSDGDGVANSEDSEPGNPNIAGEISVPGGFIMYEDLWPDKGDYDFNDLYIYISDSEFKVNADNKIVYFDLFLKVMKAGASLHNGLALRFLDTQSTISSTSYIPFDQGNMLNSVVAYSLPTNWSNGQANGDWSTMTYIDKFASNTAVLIHDIGQMDLTQGDDMSIRIYFDPNEPQPENPIPDFFLFRSNNRSLEVHLPGYPPTEYANMDSFGTGDDASLLFSGNWYKTENNYPWALYFSTDSWVPAVKENIPIFRAYPDFSGWVTSGGQENQDWIYNYDSSLTENPWSD
jgi:LruC domain-containing protein